MIKCLLRKEILQSLEKGGLRHNMKANSKYLQGINKKSEWGWSRERKCISAISSGTRKIITSN